MTIYQRLVSDKKKIWAIYKASFPDSLRYVLVKDLDWIIQPKDGPKLLEAASSDQIQDLSQLIGLFKILRPKLLFK